jgi:hypothetical protein
VPTGRIPAPPGFQGALRSSASGRVSSAGPRFHPPVFVAAVGLGLAAAPCCSGCVPVGGSGLLLDGTALLGYSSPSRHCWPPSATVCARLSAWHALGLHSYSSSSAWWRTWCVGRAAGFQWAIWIRRGDVLSVSDCFRRRSGVPGAVPSSACQHGTALRPGARHALRSDSFTTLGRSGAGCRHWREVVSSKVSREYQPDKPNNYIAKMSKFDRHSIMA